MSSSNQADEDVPVELSWVRRLQWRYPQQTSTVNEAQLVEMVRAALSTCPTLLIVDDRDIFRYLALSVLLTSTQKQSPLIQGVLVRILSKLDWDGKKRLDFVYRHVVGRPVSPQEAEFGMFFPPKSAIAPRTPDSIGGL